MSENLKLVLDVIESASQMMNAGMRERAKFNLDLAQAHALVSIAASLERLADNLGSGEFARYASALMGIDGEKGE